MLQFIIFLILWLACSFGAMAIWYSDFGGYKTEKNPYGLGNTEVLLCLLTGPVCFIGFTFGSLTKNE